MGEEITLFEIIKGLVTKTDEIKEQHQQIKVEELN